MTSPSDNTSSPSSAKPNSDVQTAFQWYIRTRTVTFPALLRSGYCPRKWNGEETSTSWKQAWKELGDGFLSTLDKAGQN